MGGSSTGQEEEGGAVPRGRLNGFGAPGGQRLGVARGSGCAPWGWLAGICESGYLRFYVEDLECFSCEP